MTEAERKAWIDSAKGLRASYERNGYLSDQNGVVFGLLLLIEDQAVEIEALKARVEKLDSAARREAALRRPMR